MATDPIRIVPVHPGTALAAPATTPLLTYRGGPLLAAVEVFTVFWGQSWVDSHATLLQQLNEFFAFVVTSPLLDQMGEYSTTGTAIGRGSAVGTITITDNEPGTLITDAAIQAQLNAWIARGIIPQPTANGLCFIYLPPGTTADLGGQQSCSSFCGYHDSTAAQIFYAVMPFADCSGCLGSLTTLDALTSTSSHELCEAITDPVPSQGWYDDANGEIGDICAWKTKQLNGWTVQLEWSNQQNNCI